MKYIITILLAFIFCGEAFSQTVPTSPYTPMTAKWYRFRNYISWDSVGVMSLTDTSQTPYRAGGFTAWVQGGDTARFMFYDGIRWKEVTGGSGGGSSDIVIDTTLSLTGDSYTITVPHGLGVTPIIVSVNQDQGFAYANYIMDADSTNIYIIYSSGQIIADITFIITLQLPPS